MRIGWVVGNDWGLVVTGGFVGQDYGSGSAASAG